MGKLKLYDTGTPREQIVKERDERYLKQSPAEKFHSLLHLISTAIAMNGGQPLKQPQGKGLIISK
ncbi:MAG: hypothetical protein JSS82_12040 [Bacteroidetes bacterium]|nr:hypothetical protein [Bacteroidota bacterium]